MSLLRSALRAPRYQTSAPVRRVNPFAPRDLGEYRDRERRRFAADLERWAVAERLRRRELVQFDRWADDGGRC